MPARPVSTLVGLLAATALSSLVLAAPAQAAVSYANCTALQKTFPHGVGRVTARDRVTTGAAVTTWKKDTAAYDRAMRTNRGLDRDKDLVACEKR